MRLAVITARGGSKRIPHKNIKSFCGKPIIVYSIEAAVKSNCFDEVMVSTDDEEIAGIARKHGAVVPFMRSGKTATDFATTADVLLEVIEEYKKIEKIFTYICCLYPTAPLISSDNLSNAFQLLQSDSTLDVVLPIVRFSFPIQRAFQMHNNKISFMNPEYALTRSQDLEPAFHDAGQFYFFRMDAFIKNKSLISKNSAAIILPELQVQDIDNLEDWILAEIKYAFIHKKKNF